MRDFYRLPKEFSMARDFSRKFYKSKAWETTRNSYFNSVDGLCERCLQRGYYVPGEIVHHKQHLTPENINDASVTLGFDNLELLCRGCHATEHPEIYHRRNVAANRVTFDIYGNIINREG